MRYLLPACLLLLVGCASTTPTSQAPPTPDTTTSPVTMQPQAPAGGAYYQNALATLKAKGDRANPQDFQRLREAHVESPDYQPYRDPTLNLVESGLAQLDSEQWDNCAKTAARIVAINYTSLAGQYIGMVCNLNAGNQDVSDGYKFALDGLLQAIWSTGNGKSRKTAFHTYSTAEQRAFLQLHNLEILDQALIHGDKGIFDVVKVKDPVTGREFKLYFNITKQWAREHL